MRFIILILMLLASPAFALDTDVCTANGLCRVHENGDVEMHVEGPPNCYYISPRKTGTTRKPNRSSPPAHGIIRDRVRPALRSYRLNVAQKDRRLASRIRRATSRSRVVIVIRLCANRVTAIGRRSTQHAKSNHRRRPTNRPKHRPGFNSRTRDVGNVRETELGSPR